MRLTGEEDDQRAFVGIVPEHRARAEQRGHATGHDAKHDAQGSVEDVPDLQVTQMALWQELEFSMRPSNKGNDVWVIYRLIISIWCTHTCKSASLWAENNSTEQGSHWSHSMPKVNSVDLRAAHLVALPRDGNVDEDGVASDGNGIVETRGGNHRCRDCCPGYSHQF